MRIVAGKYRSRKLKTLEGKQTRPTSDRVRESLFNILGARVPEAMVLDLFAGSGALGLEALSRGAQFAVLNDAGRAAVNVIQDNVEALGAQEDTGILCEDAFTAIRQLARAEMAFDLIFLDPPYDGDFYLPVLYQIQEYGILAPEGMIVCEHRKGDRIELPPYYRIYDRRVYGQTALSMIIEEVVL